MSDARSESDFRSDVLVSSMALAIRYAMGYVSCSFLG